jgi:GT2 family glycosyltransferase
MVDLSVIIVNWNTRQLVLDCLDSLIDATRTLAVEVFVVDNNSSDGSVAAIRETHPWVTVTVNASNLGFARANNVALRQMKGTYAVLLNSDTIVTKGALEMMFQFMEQHPVAGMCGPQLLNADGSRQKSIGIFPTIFAELVSARLARLVRPGYDARPGGYRQADPIGPTAVDFIMGACMVVRKKALDEVGMFDEDYFFYYEEIDWCFRMKKAGWPVYHVPASRVYHLGGRSSKEKNVRSRAESWRSRYLFFRKRFGLSSVAAGALYVLGSFQVGLRFLGYGVLSAITAFSVRRLRKRWHMFGYLFLWHLRGMPTGMCLPRE